MADYPNYPNNPQGLNAAESTPQATGIMQGNPPKAIVSMQDGSANRFPAIRYTYSHVREFVPTKTVKTGQTKYTFDQAIDQNIADVLFVPMGERTPMSFAEGLMRVYADGVVVLHQGKIVYEDYFGELLPDGQHLLMSVSKSFAGTIVADLIKKGVIDEQKLVVDYVPELVDTTFGRASVRQVLDMTTSLDYREDYNDPSADINKFALAGSPIKPNGYDGPKHFYEFLTTVKQKNAHGTEFGYKTVNTDVLGWVATRATKTRDMAELLSQHIWQPMGANFDGYYIIDSAGTAFAGGGLNANVRDLAMFGQMMLDGGYFNQQQIISQSVIDEIKRGGDRDLFRSAGKYPNLDGWSYKNQWWISHNANGAYMARGVYGQAIYIDPAAQMVVVRVASHPEPDNAVNDKYSLPAYQALADYLMKKP